MLLSLSFLFSSYWALCLAHQPLNDTSSIVLDDVNGNFTLLTKEEARIQTYRLKALAGANVSSTTFNYTCSPSPHHSWLMIHQQFFRVFNEPHCPFYVAAEFCRLNHADLASPRTRDDLDLIRILARAHQTDYFLGIYLPITAPITTACQGHNCSGVLHYADGSPFLWQDWMANLFDRHAHQPRCYAVSHVVTNDTQLPRPAICYTARSMVCSSDCPRAGIPIMPPPEPLQRKQPLIPPIILARPRRRQQFDFNSSRHEFDSGPSLNITGIGRLKHLADKASLATEPNFGLPKTDDPHHVVAYDCSDPRDIQPLRAQSQRHSCAIPAEPTDQREVTIGLLQRSDKLRLPVHHCRIQKTTFPYYCGVWSHGVFVHPWVKFLENIYIPLAECNRMWDTLAYVDPKGTHHPLLVNGTVTVQYNIAGSTVFSHNSISCVGEDYTHAGTVYHGMMVSAQLRITLETIPATVTEDERVHLARSDRILSCPMASKHCVTHTSGTYFWYPPSGIDACRFFQIRQSQGILITDQFGVDTFMSTDGSLIRLLVEDSLSRCDQVIYSTNYPKLFVTLEPSASDSAFRRPLHPDDYSFYTYANQQDSWLYGYLTNYIRKEFHSVHYQNCQQRLVESHLSYDTLLAEQHGSVDGDTAALGGGWFVTTGGEAWFKHRCRRILVTARKSTRCFSSLPVSMMDADLHRYLSFRNISLTTYNNTLEFFVEPHSRRLTTRGIAIPCTPHFYGLYRGLNDNWIKISPEISFVDSPQVLSTNSMDDVFFSGGEEFDFDAGGIYTSEDIHKMEQHLTSSRATLDVAVTMGREAQQASWASHSISSVASPFNPAFYSATLRQLSPFTIIWDGLTQWGQLVSMTMGLYYIIRICFFTYECVGRLNTPPHTGIFHHIYLAIFPRPPRSTRSTHRRRTSRSSVRSRSLSQDSRPRRQPRSRSWDSLLRARMEVMELRDLTTRTKYNYRYTPQGKHTSPTITENPLVMLQTSSQEHKPSAPHPSPQSSPTLSPVSPHPVPTMSRRRRRRVQPPYFQPRPNQLPVGSWATSPPHQFQGPPPVFVTPILSHPPAVTHSYTPMGLPSPGPVLQIPTLRPTSSTVACGMASSTSSPTLTAPNFSDLRRQLECLMTDTANLPVATSGPVHQNLLQAMNVAYATLQREGLTPGNLDRWRNQIHLFQQQAIDLAANTTRRN